MAERLYTTRELRNLVEIQERDTSQDSMGQQSTNWITIAKPYAAIEPLSGAELDFSQSLQLRVTHKVTIRYIPGLTGRNQRVLYNGSIMAIVSVRDWEARHRTLALYCEEGRVDG